MNEELVNKLPVDSTYLKELHQSQKYNSVVQFKKNMFGDSLES